MTAREKSLIGIGALVGILLAGLIYVVFMLKQQPQTDKAKQTATSEPQKSQPATSDMAGMKMDSSSDTASAANVDLTPDEEKSLGLQTVAIEKRSIKRELRSV